MDDSDTYYVILYSTIATVNNNKIVLSDIYIYKAKMIGCILILYVYFNP